MRVLYLHGFASSPQSSKATFFAAKLAALGVSFDAPDLNAPDFSTLTVTRMLKQCGEMIARDRDPVTVIGSSLGGFVALQAALRDTEQIQHVVLLAPALEFDGDHLSDLGDRTLEAWKSTGRLEVFHYGYGRMVPLDYELYEDSRQYDAMTAKLTQPVQVFQGRRDTAVNPETVERWAAARPDVELHMLDDDHQLHGSLNYIWGHVARVLHQQIP